MIQEQAVQTNKILVVDDEITLVQVCQIILEGEGHSVRGAFNGRQALRLVSDEMPDLILLDVMMPDMNGIEVCRQIRNAYPGCKPLIIMYTADAREEVRQNSVNAGADALIVKQNPFLDLPTKLTPYLMRQASLVG